MASDDGDVRKRLSNKPVSWSVVIATRAALRSLPYLYLDFTGSNSQKQVGKNLVLPVFRAMALPFAVGKYPAFGKELTASDASRAAAYVASGAAAGAASRAAAYVAYAASGVASDAAAYTASGAAAGATARAASDAFRAAAYTASGATSDAFRAATESQVENDVASLETGTSPEALMVQPLWSDEVKGLPEGEWGGLRQLLLAAADDWDVWVDWYEDRLVGRNTSGLPNEAAREIDLRIARQDNEWWKQGSKKVNADIKKWIGDLWVEVIPSDSDDEADLVSGPSAFGYSVNEGQIVAVPIGRLDESEFAKDIWADVLEKAQSVRLSLERTQAPPRVLQTLDRFVAELGGSISEVRPGRLLSRSRSLDADLAMLSTAAYRDEMPLDAQAALRDLAESVEDLRALFPELLEHETNRIARTIVDGNMSQVQQSLKDVTEIAAQSPNVEASTVTALEMANVDINEAQQVAEEATDQEVIAKAEIARSRLLALKAMDVRNFTIAVLKGAARETGQYVNDGLGRVRRGSLDGLEETAKNVTKVGLAVLATKLFGPITGLVVLNPFSSLLKIFEREVKKSDQDDNEDGGQDVG